jgi:hypothetical protein
MHTLYYQLFAGPAWISLLSLAKGEAMNHGRALSHTLACLAACTLIVAAAPRLRHFAGLFRHGQLSTGLSRRDAPLPAAPGHSPTARPAAAELLNPLRLCAPALEMPPDERAQRLRRIAAADTAAMHATGRVFLLDRLCRRGVRKTAFMRDSGPGAPALLARRSVASPLPGASAPCPGLHA